MRAKANAELDAAAASDLRLVVLRASKKHRRRAKADWDGTATPQENNLTIAAEPGAYNPCSHLANAFRLAVHFSEKLLFVQGIGWHVWGPPWRADELGARRIAHKLGAIIAREAADLAQLVACADDIHERTQREEEMSRRFKWAGTSESAPVVEYSLRMASAILTCKLDELDANPMLLGLPSGVLELDKGIHREHRQSDRITKTTGCDFYATATAPTWQRFLLEVMGGDMELVDYLQRLAGYTLCGARGENLLPILWGRGANGKTTFLSALQSMFGDYASSAAPGLLMQRGSNNHPTGMADLQGRRLVIVSETGEAGRLNEEQTKLLTGGDKITARRMRKDFSSFEPTHQLMLQTNHKPRTTGTDEGLWRRVRLIPFAQTIPTHLRDVTLLDKLKAELTGILAWAWCGWKKYRAEGLNTPTAVCAATSEYHHASDVVGSFLAECCTEDAQATASSGELYRAFSDWCKDVGEHLRSQREFGMQLAERGYAHSRGTGGMRRWRGLGLLSVPHE